MKALILLLASCSAAAALHARPSLTQPEALQQL